MCEKLPAYWRGLLERRADEIRTYRLSSDASRMRNVSVLIGKITVSKGDATHFLTTGSDARQTPVAAKARGADRISAPLSLDQLGETLSHKLVNVVV